MPFEDKSFGLPAATPPYPAPPGREWRGHLAGNGFGGYVWQWDGLFPDGSQVAQQPAATPSTVQSSSSGGFDLSPSIGPAPPSNQVGPTPPPPHLQLSFDTIGTIIPRTIGHCRTRLIPIWVMGITASGQDLTSPTMTAAYAMSQPIDPLETGTIDELFDGLDSIFTQAAGITPPDTWSVEDQAALIAAMAQIQVFPGTQSQLPASLIQSDKGISATPAWRSLRYVIIPDYPILHGMPRLSARWTRTNSITVLPPRGTPRTGGNPFVPGSGGDIIAVEFAAGSA